MANSSFRVYYGGVSVAVPFMWESQPGTPKYSFGETTLPPLTPPPSYYSNSEQKPIKTRYSKFNLFSFRFSRINPKKTNNGAASFSTLSPTPSSASLSSLNSSSFLPSTPRERSRFSSLGSSFDSRAYDEVAFASPTSNSTCFGDSKRTRNGLKLKGCYAWWWNNRNDLILVMDLTGVDKKICTCFYLFLSFFFGVFGSLLLVYMIYSGFSYENHYNVLRECYLFKHSINIWDLYKLYYYFILCVLSFSIMHYNNKTRQELNGDSFCKN